LNEIDFSQINVEEILEYFSVRNIRPVGDEVQFSCPFPEHARGDRNPSSSINRKNGKWHCFGCGRSGTLISFVAEYEKVAPSQVTKWLRGEYGLQARTLVSEFDSILNTVSANYVERILPEQVLELFRVDWHRCYEAYLSKDLPRRLSILFERSFSPDTLSFYNFGYDKRTNRITIPVRNLEGSLVGFKGRSTSYRDRPKYLSIGDKGETVYYGFPTVKVTNYVYLIGSASDEHGIIVEGELDAIRLREYGYKGSVALGGSNPSKAQIQQIKNRFSSITLLLDPDEAGDKEHRKLNDSLLHYMPVRIAELSESDPADTPKEQIDQIIKQAQTKLQIN
jgi:DNA primase